MADHLARIFGTEEDKVNCSFFYKIGACRHGDRCTRTHVRPNFSQTVLIPHMYAAPPPGPDGQPVDDKEHFEEFYEEVMEELSKYGEIEELNVVENLGDHMFGNVYIKYSTEEEAEACTTALRGRYYGGRLVLPEFSPVTDFREARCRQFDEESCARGGYCNFMHLKHVPRHLRKMLHKLNKQYREKKRKEREKERRHRRHGSRSRSRSRSRDRRRHSKSRSRSRSRGRDRDKERERAKDREDMKRSGSAERRAKIALWNKEKDKEKDVPKDKEKEKNNENKEKEKEKEKDKDRKADLQNGKTEKQTNEKV